MEHSLLIAVVLLFIGFKGWRWTYERWMGFLVVRIGGVFDWVSECHGDGGFWVSFEVKDGSIFYLERLETYQYQVSNSTMGWRMISSDLCSIWIFIIAVNFFLFFYFCFSERVKCSSFSTIKSPILLNFHLNIIPSSHLLD